MTAAWPYRLRLVVEGAPVLYAGIDPCWDLAVCARTQQEAPRCLPPVRAADVRDASSLDDLAARLFWTRWFLQRAPKVLHAGSWLVSSSELVPRAAAWRYPATPAGLDGFPPPWLDDAPWRASWVERWGYAADDPEAVGAGGVLALRHVDDDSRLRWWRRCARRGLLPPLFTLFVPLLQRFIVLDGHLRWRAALEEGVVPTILVFWPTRSWPRMDEVQQAHMRALVADLQQRTRISVADANDTATTSHASAWCPQLRAWPLPGGAAAWSAEVLASGPRDVRHALLELLE